MLQGVDPPDRFVALVREIEELGFDQLWLTDSSLHARDVYAYLTLAATVTTRLRLGSSVTNPLTRHPAIGALAIATVDAISGGRAVYGIGVGDRPMAALGHRPATLQVLRESVAVTRRLLRGEHVSFTSDRFVLQDAQVRVTTRPEIPIYVSASGPKTLELAGEIGDGVIVLAGLCREGVEYALDHVRRGRGRSSRALDVAVFAYGCLRDDPDLAIEQARPIAAWFCQTAPVHCRLAGIPRDVVERVRASYRGGEFQEAKRAAELIPGEAVRKIALAGDGRAAAAKVRMLLELGVRNVNIFPLGEDRLETIRQFARHVL